MIETLAEWYLRRRGRVVLSRSFVGVAVGYCHVFYDKERNAYTVLPMWLHGVGSIIALNNSMVVE